VIPSQPGLYRPDLHYRGEWPGIYCVAFTKIPLVCNFSSGFTSRTNTVLLLRWVTNKTKLNKPRHPPLAGQSLFLAPIDGPTAKPTTPQVHIINQLRASHSTLMVVLLSQVVSQRSGPYGEVLRKQPESPKVSQVHHHNQDNIIVS
jgi:hypothetical protein